MKYFLKSFLHLTALLACISAARAQILPPLNGTPALAGSGGSSFTFVVLGDSRPAKPTDRIKDGPLPAILKSIAGVKPAFIVWAGDTIYGKDESAQTYQDEYAGFLKLLQHDVPGVPVFNAPGNHELDNSKDIPKKSITALYTQYVCPKLYGSFQYGGSDFIALNTDDLGFPGDDNAYDGYVGEAQQSWLKGELASQSRARHIFVFMHRPIHQSYASAKEDDDDHQLGPPSWSPVRDLLEQSMAKYPNLSFVFASHQHLYYAYDPKDPKNPRVNQTTFSRIDPTTPAVPPVFLITGGGGAPVTGSKHGKTPSKELGEFHHYLVVTVDGANVTCKMVSMGD